MVVCEEGGRVGWYGVVVVSGCVVEERWMREGEKGEETVLCTRPSQGLSLFLFGQVLWFLLSLTIAPSRCESVSW